MANPAVIVDFVANTKDLQKGFDQAGGKAGALGGKLKGLALGVAAAGFAALTATIKTGVGEWAQAQKVTAQTDAVLKSTGKAAGVTSKQVQDLAGALMEKSGVDDEAIQSGENLLLTFTNIRNEAGKNNDIFNQATKTALDMSVALGQDVTQSAMQLGKALNDPVKGMTALQRVGVTFTDAQKKQVEAMQKAGDTAGAQKIILAELQKEFGGSAEAAGKTLPGQLKILKEEFSNFAGALVGAMIPALTAVADLMTKHRGVVIAVVAVLATLTAATMAVSAATAAWNALQIAAQVASKLWAAAQWLVNAALAANPIMLVVVAIAALVAGLIIAYKTSDTFRAIVDAAFDAVLNAAKAVFDWLKANWPLLLAIITGPIGIAVLEVIRHWDTIKRAVQTAVDAVKGAVTSAWNTVKSATSSAWGAITGAVSDAVSAVKGALNALATWVSGFASGVLSAALNRVRDVWDKISDGARAARDAAKDALNNLVSFVEGIVSRIAHAAESVANAIKAPINAVLRAWNSISLTIPTIKIPSIKVGKHKIGGGSFGGQTISFPNVPLLAQGGIIDQPTLALLGEAGPEAVIPLKDMAPPVVQVRVFIGQTELTELVRTEILDANTGLARTLLAGSA